MNEIVSCFCFSSYYFKSYCEITETKIRTVVNRGYQRVVFLLLREFS